jgi:hypothetical protein
MEPYRKVYRRKIPVLEPISPEWKPASPPLDKRELRALGYIGVANVEIDESVMVEFPDRTPPEDIVA